MGYNAKITELLALTTAGSNGAFEHAQLPNLHDFIVSALQIWGFYAKVEVRCLGTPVLLVQDYNSDILCVHI